MTSGRWNPDKNDFSHVFCAGYMLSELVAAETKTQIAGVTNIADASGEQRAILNFAPRGKL
jgi:hypothetical protein